VPGGESQLAGGARRIWQKEEPAPALQKDRATLSASRGGVNGKKYLKWDSGNHWCIWGGAKTNLTKSGDLAKYITGRMGRSRNRDTRISLPKRLNSGEGSISDYQVQELLKANRGAREVNKPPLFGLTEWGQAGLGLN